MGSVSWDNSPEFRADHSQQLPEYVDRLSIGDELIEVEVWPPDGQESDDPVLFIRRTPIEGVTKTDIYNLTGDRLLAYRRLRSMEENDERQAGVLAEIIFGSRE